MVYGNCLRLYFEQLMQKNPAKIEPRDVRFEAEILSQNLLDAVNL